VAELKMEISCRDVPEVRAELERLRGLIKAVEWSSGEDAYSCPWCDADRYLMRYGNGRPVKGTGAHRETCPAFTPSGEVK
jgi:hypothetical protein